MSEHWLDALPKQDECDRRVREARSRFMCVVGLWVGAALMCAALCTSMLYAHEIYNQALARNTDDKQTADRMWRSYCSRPLHEIDLDQVQQDLRRELDCKWAKATKDMDAERLAYTQIRVPWLFSHYDLLQPRRVIYTVIAWFALGLSFPGLAAFYWFRASRIQANIVIVADRARPTVAQRASLNNVILPLTRYVPRRQSVHYYVIKATVLVPLPPTGCK